METMQEVAQALISVDEPSIFLLTGDGLALTRPLGDMHPVDLLASLPAMGDDVQAVGIMAHGTARNYDTGEPVGRITMAYAMSRDDAAAVMLSPTGVSTEAPTEVGAIPDAIRAFLAR